MQRALYIAVACAGVVTFGHSVAAVTNELPSCYAANKIPLMAPAAGREILVLIDQTTQFDEKLQASVVENLRNFLQRDTTFTVASFSAFSQGRYTEVVYTGRIEPGLKEADRDSTSVRLLRTFDECMQAQQDYAKRHAGQVVRQVFDSSSANLARSDILAALKEISARVRTSGSTERVLFIVSDMLENSSITSFYSGPTKVRTIEPAKEMVVVDKANMFGEFGGARVYVLGAGLLGPSADAQTSYRDPKTMAALREFWTLYFARTGAKLEQFGQPALLQPIR